MSKEQQFGLFTLLLVILVFSVTFAALGGLLRASDASSGSFQFILILVAGPVVTMIAISLIRSLIVKKKPKRRRPPES